MTNWIEINLSKDDDDFVRAAAEKFKTVHITTIDNVFEWARAIELIRRAFYGSGHQGAFGEALVQYGFAARDGTAINPAIRSAYDELRKNEPAVRAWWASVPERKKRDWLSAKSVHRHWKNSLKARDPDKRKPTPLQAERATNVELQQQLHVANERLKTADGGNLFDINRDSPEEIGRAIVEAWLAAPVRIAILIKTLTEKLPEAQRRYREARPRPRGRRSTETIRVKKKDD